MSFKPLISKCPGESYMIRNSKGDVWRCDADSQHLLRQRHYQGVQGGGAGHLHRQCHDWRDGQDAASDMAGGGAQTEGRKVCDTHQGLQDQKGHAER